MPLYQDENAALSHRDRTVQPPDLLARSGLPVPTFATERVPQFNADFRRLVARISSLFALIAPTAQGAPSAATSLSLVAHAPQHQAGGDDEINVQDLRGLLRDDQHPLPHGLVSDRHTASGLTVGDVLRATAADAFVFQALQVSDLPLAARTRTLDFTGVDVPSLTASDFFTRIPFAGIITGWSIFADAPGSLQLDVWRTTLGAFPPSVANSLVGGGNKPALVASQAAAQAPAGWTSVSLAADDVIAIHLDAAAGVNKATLVLEVLQT